MLDVTAVAINNESKVRMISLLEKREPRSKETSGPLWPITFGPANLGLGRPRTSEDE
jgi:hypothetical protein